jgi:hypothetical protein
VEVPWRQRTSCRTFVHNAGHGGLRGRNGTKELYTALPHVQSPIRLILRSQERVDEHLQIQSTTLQIGNVTVDYRFGTFPYDTLWDEGDAFVFPEKFNGLSLPLQEARAAGMVVLATDRFPMNGWLPKGPLIRSHGWQTAKVGPPYLSFREEIVHPKDVAAAIDVACIQSESGITRYSQDGREWAEGMSWKVLGPQYQRLLEQLAGGEL